jgi:Flp pilus assembly pilin Flp
MGKISSSPSKGQLVRGPTLRASIMWQFLNNLLRETDAATSVEYAVMLALIMGTIFASVVSFGNATSGTWNNVQISIHNAGVGS